MPEGQKTKSAKQMRFLMSKNTPLNPGELSKLKSEVRSGKVKIKGKKKRKGY